MDVRQAIATDAPAVHRLLEELGYTPDYGLFAPQFARYIDGDLTRVWVSVGSTAAPIGVLAACRVPLLHEPGDLGRITALVVTGTARSAGVGAALVAVAEAWFAASGCSRIEVTSNEARLRAHAFYQRQGYARSGMRFLKRREPA